MTRRGAIIAALMQASAGQLAVLNPPTEFRLLIGLPLVITDGKTTVRLTPAEIMEALSHESP